MNVQEAYNIWAEQYDTNKNKTRDLEGIALREVLSTISFDKALEIGCGTGKNTEWLIERAQSLTSVDLSEGMLEKAREKVTSDRVIFVKADINQSWEFAEGKYDLISFSLVLEHIEVLEEIFRKAAEHISPGGYVYVGELHPFKQYIGTKARFQTEQGTQIVDCFNHNITDFTNVAIKNGFLIDAIQEHFDDSDRAQVPRILTLLFRKA